MDRGLGNKKDKLASFILRTDKDQSQMKYIVNNTQLGDDRLKQLLPQLQRCISRLPRGQNGGKGCRVSKSSLELCLSCCSALIWCISMHP